MGAASEETVPASRHYTIESNACSILTLSRSFTTMPFTTMPFQSTPVGWLGLAILSPNPAAYLHVGVWDKTWNKYANYFETACPQFHFCPGDKMDLF